MTIGGWIVMTVSIAAATTLFAVCIIKVLTTKDETEHMDSFAYKEVDWTSDDD